MSRPSQDSRSSPRRSFFTRLARDTSSRAKSLRERVEIDARRLAKFFCQEGCFARKKRSEPPAKIIVGLPDDA